MFCNQRFRQQPDTGHGAEAQVWVSLVILHVTSLDTKRSRRDSEKGPEEGAAVADDGRIWVQDSIYLSKL